MKNIFLFILMILMCTALLADISQYYTFSASMGTYTEITGTAVTAAQGDDVLSGAIDIGFPMLYGASSYTQIKISSNGYVALGAPTSETRFNALPSTTVCPILAALWDDLHTGRVQGTTYPQTSSVQYILNGSAPNREFIVQYKNAYWYYNATPASWVNFQIVLKENGNVQFKYGSNAATSPGTSATASIGINMLPGGATNYLSVTPGEPATATNTAENATISAYIPEGTIYEFSIPIPVSNDLAVISLTGNLTPSQGTAIDYTVTVRNSGTSAQTNYSVKLMSGTTELASVAGPAIQPGISTPVQLTWTPQATGAIAIFAKVVLGGDENPQNDVTPPINVDVQPAGATLVIVGTGTSTQRQPFGVLFGWERDATLLTSAQLNQQHGLLIGLRWYCSTVAATPVPYKIWIKTTTETTMTATPWDTFVTGAVLVKEGTQVFDQVGWANFTLTSPFMYTTDNLIVMVETFYGGTGISTYPSFSYSVSDTGQHQYWYADNAPPTGNGNLNANKSNIGLLFSAVGTDPVFGVSPESKNYGTILMNQSVSQPFSVFNMGGGSLTISSISLTGSPMFNLQNLPTLPLTLGSGLNSTFVAQYAPTAAGTHTGTITITDNLARVTHTVALTGTCIDPTIYTSPYVQAFDAVTTPNIPIDWQKHISGGTASTCVTSTTTPHSPANSVYMYNSADAASNLILVSPPIVNTLPINTMRTKFWAKGGANYTLSVGVMTNPQDPATYTEIQVVTLTAAWAEYTVGFQTYTGAGHYLAYKHGLGGTYRGIYIDDVQIEVIPQNDLGAVSINGNSTPSVGMATIYQVGIFNWGTNPQSTYQVKLFKEGDVEVASVAGPTIQPGTQALVPVTWSPTVQGSTFIYGKVVLAGDQNALNNQTANFTVAIQPPGMMLLTIGDGVQTARTPMDFYYKNSLSETIYLQSELNTIGSITGIALYNNFFDDRQNMPTKIWMGTTTLTDLSAGWIPSTDLTSVFDGNVSYPIGENTVVITFPTPFIYLSGNLVVMFHRPMETVFYSISDYFKCQTIGTNRALKLQSDTVVYDPAAPVAGTLSGQFAKTSFFIIPGGVGHITGTVYGANNQPLSGADVQIVNGAQTTTDATGHYGFQNLIAGAYQVTVSRNGYVTQTQDITVPEDQTVTLNFNMVQMTTVVLSGRVVGSDAPTVGLAGAIVNFTGYEDYSVIANATGYFSLSGVYTNQTYAYTATFAGYQAYSSNVEVVTTNVDMGNIILAEVAYSPRNVTAVANTGNTAVNVNWLAPDPNTADVGQGFENANFPPTEWSRTVTNNGAPNENGVYPTWCRFGVVTVNNSTVTPPEGSWQAGFMTSYSHQDEWLMTPQFNCPQGASLVFDSNVFLGSTLGDHYYVKASVNNGTDWTVLWDASALTGGWNHYQTPISIDLAQFTGQQIKLAWHADDSNTNNDGMYYVWFIDNVTIGNTTQTLRFDESQMLTKTAGFNARSSKSTMQSTRNTDRSLVGYKIWRLPQGQEQNEVVWTSLSDSVITTLSFSDTGWATLAEDTYKWAVKGVYTNNVLSLAIFSNPVVRPPVVFGTLAGSVHNALNQPVMGAEIHVGTLTAVTAANGSYVLQVPEGTYNVSCTATGYVTQTQLNVIITGGQTTPINFNLATVANDDNVVVNVTALKGNYPNPFNPETTLSYDIKDRAPVRIDIYNAKGQLIRTLVNEVKATGHYNVIWNGKDSNGNAVASGVYHYRMQSGNYQSTHRMMLMK